MAYFSFNRLPLFSSDIVMDSGMNHSKEKDTIVLIHPFTAMWEAPTLFRCTKPLEEQIEYVRQHNIKKATVVAENIEFLRQCPSLEYLHIIPSDTVSTFDYSPLYDLPNVRYLICVTVFGDPKRVHTSIDYSRLPKLEFLSIEGKGHLNYQTPEHLKVLAMGPVQPAEDNLKNVIQSKDLQALILCQVKMSSLDGIENAPQLKRVDLSYNRKLTDISALAKVKDSLTYLDIETCGNIKDYSVLHELHNLECLRLGSNVVLPDLSFLKNMPKLKLLWFLGTSQDGDVSVCDNLPGVYFQNRRHYNRKSEQYKKACIAIEKTLDSDRFLRV
jgi:hypothetical protein